MALYAREISKTYSWISTCQNSDGGFPAFDTDKNDNQYKILKFVFKMTGLDRSAEIFDPSCADIVGHILEGLGSINRNSNNSELDIINKAVRFLITTKK